MTCHRSTVSIFENEYYGHESLGNISPVSFEAYKPLSSRSIRQNDRPSDWNTYSMVTTERGNNEALRPTSRLGSQRSTVNSSTFDVSSVLKNLRPESPSNTSNRGKQADEDYVNHYPLSAARPQLSGECAVQDDQCTNTNAVWEIQAQDSSVNSEKCHYPLRADFVIGNKSFVKFPRSSSFYNSRPYYHSSPRTSMSSSTVLPLKRATSSPSRTSLTASQSFLQTPGPLNDFIRCRIERSKSGILSGPTRYTMTFESFPPDFPNTFGIVTAMRSSRPYAPARFQIHLTDASDISGHQECVAELHASFLGTEYRLFGCQSHSGKNSDSNVGRLSSEGEDTASLTAAWHGKKSKSRPIKHELCSVTYAQNMLGTQGPRRAMVLLPKLVPGTLSAWDLQPYNMDNVDYHSSLLDRHRHGERDACIALHNRPPRWNDNLKAYCLNFGGRVTKASVKNIQLVAEDDPDRLIVQFGRIAPDEFILDYRFPMTAAQAFAVGLASLDPKLGCE